MLRFAVFVRSASLVAFASLSAVAACSNDTASLPDLPDAPDAPGPTDTDLALAITGPDAATPGDALSYAIDVTNLAGTADGVTVTQEFGASAVQIVSATGAGWACSVAAGKVTCTRAELAQGANAEPITVTATAPSATGTVAASASVASTTRDRDASNNAATVTTQVLAPADLAVELTASAASVAAAGPIDYAIKVTNHSAGASGGIVVVDTLPDGGQYLGFDGDGWTCDAAQLAVTCHAAALSGGAATTVTLHARAPHEVGTIVDQVTVSSALPDPDTSNNHAQVSAMTTAAADLRISQTVSSSSVVVGGGVTYTVTVNNDGPSSAASVAMVETMPDEITVTSATGTGWSCRTAGQVVTCTMATLARGTTAQPISIVGKVVSSRDTAPSASARVSSATPDGDDSNNSARIAIFLDDKTDLALTMTANTDAIHVAAPSSSCDASNCVTHIVTIKNLGPATAQDLDVAVFVPDSDGTHGLGSFVDFTAPGWTCTFDGYLDCTRTTLDVNASSTISLRWLAPPSVPSATLNFDASVFLVSDTNHINDEVTSSTRVVP